MLETGNNFLNVIPEFKIMINCYEPGIFDKTCQLCTNKTDFSKLSFNKIY